MLRRDVLVFEVVRFLKRTLQHVVQRTPHVLLGKTLHFWQASDLALNLLGQRFVGHAQPRQKWRHNAIGLRHQGGQQMDWLNLLVFMARGNFLRALHGLLGFDGHFFKSQHRSEERRVGKEGRSWWVGYYSSRE